jgi:hypothetical protein
MSATTGHRILGALRSALRSAFPSTLRSDLS